MTRIIHIYLLHWTLFILLLRNVASSFKIQKLTTSVELGEGPHWSDEEQKLYYVDINGQRIMRYNPQLKTVTFAYLKCGHVGAVVPVEGHQHKLMVGCGNSVVIVTWSGDKNVTDPKIEKLRTLGGTGIRVNDGKCDPSGRYVIGTMALKIDGHVKENQGTLYSIDDQMTLTKLYSPVTISNGLAWSSNNKTFYYIDSASYQIWKFDYDNSKGTIGEKSVIFDLKSNEIIGLPDGMTIDTDGNLWIALMFGGAVIQVDPKKGKVMQLIRIPDVDRVSSVAFGGRNFDVLYVTTARDEMTEEELKLKPASGCLFSIEGLGVRGYPAVNYKINNFSSAGMPTLGAWVLSWFLMLSFMKGIILLMRVPS